MFIARRIALEKLQIAHPNLFEMGDYMSHFAPEEPHSVGRGSLKEEDQNLVLIMLEYICHCVVKEYLALSSISENIKSLPLFRGWLSK